MIIPGEKSKIRKEIEKAREKYGPLSAEQKRKIAKRVHAKVKRNFKIGLILAAIGITTGIGAGVKLLDAPKQNDKVVTQEQTTSTREEFINQIKVDTTELDNVAEVEVAEENKIFEQIVEEYNAKYPDTPISEEDLGMIETQPQFLTKQTNEDGSITYIENYKTQADQLQANQEYIYGGCGDVYIVVNKKDNTIILSQAAVDYNEVNFETKIAMVGDKEYVASERSLTLGETAEEKREIYNQLKDKFKEILEEKQNPNKSENDYEIDY